LSEPTTAETENYDINSPGDLPRDLTETPGENPPDDAATSRTNIDLEAMFNSDPLLDQLEMQVGLLTSAMTRNMILATGAVPDLTEGPLPETPRYGVGYGKPKPVERATKWTDARSLHLRDAARLSFATASLIGAYAKLKGPAPQRITARYTIVPDPGGGKKSRKITTVTHHVIAAPDAQPRATQKG
jgi:hypothetical protein